MTPLGLPFFESGWSVIEPWGIWSDGREAVLSFPVSSVAPTGLSLEVDGHAYLADHVPQQRVIVQAGGQEVGEWTYSVSNPSSIKTVAFPKDASAQGRPVTVTLKFPDAASPKGSDHRLLGIGIVRMRLVSTPL